MRIIDASECILGRLASSIAKELLNGEEVHIINAEMAVISGTKDRVVGEYIEKRKLNHPRKGPYYPRMPHMMLKRAVRGMIPYQKPRGREAFKRLKVDVGKPNSVDGKIEVVNAAIMNKGTRCVTLGEVSKVLGAKF